MDGAVFFMNSKPIRTQQEKQRPAEVKKFNRNRQLKCGRGPGPDVKILTDQLREFGHCCSAGRFLPEACCQFEEAGAGALLIVIGYELQDGIVGRDDIGSRQGVSVDDRLQRCGVPALQEPAFQRPVFVNGAAAGLFV